MYSDNTLQEIKDFVDDLEKAELNSSDLYEAGYQHGFVYFKEKILNKIHDMNKRLQEFEEEIDSGQIRMDTFGEMQNGDEVDAEDLAEMVADKIVSEVQEVK